MSAYPPTGPDRPDRPDELGDLLAAGLERDLATPVDTGRLLDGARTGAVRLRRRRRAYGAVTAVLLVAAVPFGMTRMTGLLGTTGGLLPTAHDTLTGDGPAGRPGFADVPPEEYKGDLRPFAGPGGTLAVTVDIPAAALLVPEDANADLGALLTVRGAATPRTTGVYDTVDPVCRKQPGGLGWNLRSVVRTYDEQASTTAGWELKTVVRALTVTGARSQLRSLQRTLESCTPTIGEGRWTLQPAVGAGEDRVLATIQEGDAVLAVGVVRVGAATSGFCLRVPGEAGSPAVRRQLALTNGQALLTAAADRLVASDVSGKAVEALRTLMQSAGGTSVTATAVP